MKAKNAKKQRIESSQTSCSDTRTVFYKTTHKKKTEKTSNQDK